MFPGVMDSSLSGAHELVIDVYIADCQKMAMNSWEILGVFLCCYEFHDR